MGFMIRQYLRLVLPRRLKKVLHQSRDPEDENASPWMSTYPTGERCRRKIKSTPAAELRWTWLAGLAVYLFFDALRNSLSVRPAFRNADNTTVFESRRTHTPCWYRLFDFLTPSWTQTRVYQGPF